VSTLRNRLTQNHQGARVAAEADAKALIAEQLTRLEDDLRRLKVEFDIFLNGGAKRPPYDTKNRVETTIKRLADERSMPFAQRYSPRFKTFGGAPCKAVKKGAGLISGCTAKNTRR
jgi:hypothetical protein